MKLKLYFLGLLIQLLSITVILLSGNVHLGMISIFGFSSAIGFWTPYILVVLLLCILGYLIFKMTPSIKKRLLFISASTILSTSLLFLITPFYPEDFKNSVTQLTAPDYPIATLDSISDTEITCFFLSNCPFCEIASRELNAHFLGGNISDIKFVYYAYEATADSLTSAQNIVVPYKNMESDDFFKVSGNDFPVIIRRNSDTTIDYWSGNSVNFACFDDLKQN